jgi:HAD superfamily hydrolase (TIGR01549 family)
VAVKAVVFDFGYTLVNEDRVWRETAAQYGWPESLFFSVLGAVIERRQSHRRVFEILEAAEPPEPVPFEPQDFYEDALPCLRAVKRKGRVVGIAGNTSLEIEDFLSAHADVDFVASSARWGTEKPQPEFFYRVAEAAGCDPGEIMYVGDRVDNDVAPAAAAGMVAVHLLRGPWAAIQRDWPEARVASVVCGDLGSIFPV